MFWKNWPYWLRGGVIVGGIVIVSMIYAYPCTSIYEGYDGIGCLVFLLPIYPALVLFNNLELPFLILILISIAAWFIVGSLTGVIVGFVKSKMDNSISK